MSGERLRLIRHTLATTKNQWFGGPSAAGSLRNVPCELAIRKPKGLKYCIWELALHNIAYWEYAVRRMLENGPKGGFPRTPSNWPTIPEEPSEDAWKMDRKLVKQEREALIATIQSIDEKLLREHVSSSSRYTYAEVLTGIAQHSVYHTGQIGLLKRLELRELAT